jgi:hypothetical protein
MQQVTTGTDYLEFKVQHNGGGTQAVTASVMAWAGVRMIAIVCADIAEADIYMAIARSVPHADKDWAVVTTPAEIPAGLSGAVYLGGPVELHHAVRAALEAGQALDAPLPLGEEKDPQAVQD